MPDPVTAGQLIVDALRAEGVRFVFGMPGGHVLGIYDALFRTPEIRHVLVRHEQSAASMAAAYSQLTGEPGVCLVTAGPGATNLLTGIAESYVGALPVIVFAGRASTATALRGASQEIATERIFAPVSKWAVRVDRADLLASVVRQAFATAQAGKPGPVYIDIPRDLLGEKVPAVRYIPAGPAHRPAADRQAVHAAAQALLAARRPIIVAGGGTRASGAFAELGNLADMLAAPVLTSLSGRSCIPDDHPLSVGGLGAHRNPLSKRLLAEADVVFSLGCRFEEMETNWRPGFVPGPDACNIQVDIDPSEIGRSIPAQIGVVGDIRQVLRQLLDTLPPRPDVATRMNDQQRYAQEVSQIERQLDQTAGREQMPPHSLAVIRAIRRVFPREATMAVDVGCSAQQIGGSFPAMKVYEPRSVIAPSSFYGMGFASAGLPVARLVYPERPAFGLVGDGSFQMIMNVLPVAVEHKLPVTWCVLDDHALSSIWDIQQYVYDRRVIGTEFSSQPDFSAVAQACGCYGEKVNEAKDITGALSRALTANQAGQPAVLDFDVSRDRLPQTREHYLFYPDEDVSPDTGYADGGGL